ncbi:uncharacterized protein LOC122463678 isoform X1 [Chelonia mydas]|uniref:uncharacterized protein LOC122463678 isoform X1 n=1 Tax=Chelonia mydas TaxID=8469 RepID=UPI001CA8DE14|nr:uncharacterized protein LOC122463678 isoform X1 [Chelonia mydas]
MSSAAALSPAAGRAASQPPARQRPCKAGTEGEGQRGQERRRQATRREERRARPRPRTMQALLTSRVGSLRSFATSTRHQMKNKVPEHQKLFQAPVTPSSRWSELLSPRRTNEMAAWTSWFPSPPAPQGPVRGWKQTAESHVL